MTTSIAELKAAGVKFEAEEAVAVAQQLIHALRQHRDADEVQPPYGSPSADNVFLNEDGSVVCPGCTTTPAVLEVGIFLDSLLPAGSPRVPGGLRYTIARALLDVDVPPFDSLDELSRALDRHEHGARADIVRGVLRRAGGGRRVAPLSLVERRRAQASPSELRRALREADARLYERQRIVEADAPKVPPARGRTLTASAACIAAGLALIATGELMHRHSPPLGVTQAAPLAARVAAPEKPRVDRERGLVPERGIIAVRQAAPSPSSVSRPEPRRISAKRTSRPPAVVARRQAGSRPASRSVLDRLRLGWLRNAFAVDSDL